MLDQGGDTPQKGGCLGKVLTILTYELNIFLILFFKPFFTPFLNWTILKTFTENKIQKIR